MKTMEFRYYLKIEFDCPVTQHSFTVKCVPQSDDRQKIIEQNIHILPREFLCENRDSFGNSYFFGKAQLPHTLFEVVSEGTAQTGLAKGTKAGAPYQLGMFAGQTPYTEPGRDLRAFFDSLTFGEEQSGLEKSLMIMEALRGQFAYVQGKTDISTTAQQAWNIGCGVCQDYSHIMLSLCRMAGIQSRYVVGMLLGEGLSHAWVEVADRGVWYGLDAANGVQVLEDHIKISHGRDYADCLINQGVFTGNARQLQEVSVSVKQIETK